MSARRRLVSRTNQDAPSSPSASAAQGSSAAARTALPPYEPPLHALTASAKQQLVDLTQETDYAKYRKHLATAMATLANATADSNDALSAAKESLKKQVEKRRAKEAQQGGVEGDDGRDKENGGAGEKTEEEIATEEQVRSLEEKVERLTREAEKATRDLIDYSEELKGQESLISGVVEKASVAPARSHNSAARAAARRRRAAAGDSDDEAEDPDVEMSDAGDPADILSPSELLKQAREEAEAKYTAKSLRARYGDNKDYQTFKTLLHESSNYGADAPPLPPSSTWFPSENAHGAAAGGRRRRQATTDNTGNGADSDDELVFAGAVSSLKCPLTLQTFRAPYSNQRCRHTFEKGALLEMFESGATVFHGGSQARGGRERGAGVRRLMCPSAGCEAMLELGDFYEDQMVARQVRRAAANEAAEREAEEESEEEVARPRGKGRPKRETMDVEVVEDSQRVKKQEEEKEEEVQVEGTQA